MFGKLLALLTQLKAAGAAVVIVAGAATVTVASTSPEVQDTLHQLENNIGLTQSTDCGDHGQPVVVAQRNAADKLLRDAYQRDQKALQDLRGGKDVDNKAVGDVVKKADSDLRDALNTALNAVAAQTLGRNGQNKASASPSASASPTATAAPTPTGSASAQPSCTPAPSASASPSASGSASPKPSASGKPEEGRVAVAERTTLDPAIQKIVDDATTLMDKIVKDATTAVGALPTPDHGKPSGNPGNGNKPEDKGKPSGTPSHP